MHGDIPLMSDEEVNDAFSSPSPGLFVVFLFHLVPVSRIIKKPASAGGLFWGILSA
jgi:hypothetical protein